MGTVRKPRVYLTLPVAEAGGFSGYACGNPLRSRLTGLPGPTAWGTVSEETAITKPCRDSVAHTFKTALSPRHVEDLGAVEHGKEPGAWAWCASLGCTSREFSRARG